MQAGRVEIINGSELANILSLLQYYPRQVYARFPSPAEDFLDHKLDLNNYLIKHPDSTYFLRVSGDSMKGVGIYSGDILIVDRALPPADNKVIIACISGELFVKRLRIIDGCHYLVSENSNYSPIKVTDELDIEYWGVAFYALHLL